MKLRKQLLILLALLCIQVSLKAQAWRYSRYEIVSGISIYHSFDDIGGSSTSNNLGGIKDFSFAYLRPGISIGMRYKVNDRIYAKAILSTGMMASKDAGSINETRGFKVNIFASDLSMTAEFYITKPADNRYFSIMAVRGGVRPYGNPYGIYLFAGVGGAFFAPNGNAAMKASQYYDGSSSFAAVFPLGVGIKLNLRPRISFNGEFGTRITTTDRMDGYKSPYSKSNDLYYVVNFGVSYQLVQKMKFRTN